MQDHYWVVEEHLMGKWQPLNFFVTRSEARRFCAKKLYTRTRIRKFIAA